MPKVKPKPKEVEPVPEVPEKPPSRGLFRLLFRPPVLLLLAAAACAFALGPQIKSLLPNLRDRAEYRVGVDDIVLTPPPAWIPRDFVEQVLKRAGLPAELSLLDDDLGDTLARAFESHPWVSQVAAVRKSKPARVEVDVVYRRPVALVRMKEGLYPVDAAAVLLPPGDFSAGDVERYPLIVNVAAPPVGPAGTEWGDVGVQGAARLAEVLAGHWKEFRLAAIAVPRREAAAVSLDAMVFELVTAGGSRIIWGRAPQSSSPGELSPEHKISRLKDYLSRFGSFDEPHGPYEIDIRHWQDMSRRPLARNGR
jgi:hypothetical protein